MTNEVRKRFKQLFKCKVCPETCQLGGWQQDGYCGAECTNCLEKGKDGRTLIARYLDEDNQVVYQCDTCRYTFKIPLE